MDDYLPKRIIELEYGKKFETNRPRQSAWERFTDKCTERKFRSELREAWSYYPSCDY